MSKLRVRMIEDLQLAGMSTYVREVVKLSEFFSKSPSEITDEELRTYFLLAGRVHTPELSFQSRRSYVSSRVI